MTLPTLLDLKTPAPRAVAAGAGGVYDRHLQPTLGEQRFDRIVFDADYLDRLRRRDPGTLNHFCESFYVPIRNRVRHKFPHSRADDLVQDVFLKALSRIDAGEPQDPAKLPGYVFGISSLLILRGFGDIKKDRCVDFDASVLPDVKERADAQLIRKLDQTAVQKVLKKLSSRDRDVITRVYFQQQETDAAAREMNVTQDYLRVLLFRALKRFRAEWDKHNK